MNWVQDSNKYFVKLVPGKCYVLRKFFPTLGKIIFPYLQRLDLFAIKFCN